MNAKKRKRLEKRKQKQPEHREDPGDPPASGPVMSALNRVYDVSERILAIESGGLGAVHTLQ